jgi:hypothetical protein
MLDALLDRHHQLRRNGYLAIPLIGKIPPMKSWQLLTSINADMLRLWMQAWPAARNIGCLCRYMPTIDVDIFDADAATAVEDIISAEFCERGAILVRIGKAPKRAIIFKVDQQPYRKITVPLVSPHGAKGEKVELLCDGQQVVVDGIHPDTGAAYRWFGGTPLDVPRAELPYLDEAAAHKLVDAVVKVLTGEFGYTTPSRSIATGRGVGNGTVVRSGEDGWRDLVAGILSGSPLHDSIRDLASKLIAGGLNAGATTHLLGALVELSETSHDQRWETRYRSVPRLVDSAVQKYRRPATSHQR